MAKNKYYAVKKGNKTGIFDSWEECKEAISHYSNPEYKGFSTREEAEAYMNNRDIIMEKYIEPKLNEGRVVAFTDGSYDDKKKCYGSGVYLFLPNRQTKEISIKGNNDKYVNERNIAGEVIAVINAVDWVMSNGYDKLTVFYDLKGIGEWASDNWKANTNCSKFFKNFILDKKDIVDIEFEKVKAHSNNFYNNKADSLAKGAVLENRIFQDHENSGYLIHNISEVQIDNLVDEITQYNGVEPTKSKADNKTTWILQFEKNKLNITFFTSKNKLLVQGKLSILFKMFTSLLIERLNNNNLFQILNILSDAYKMRIDENSINNTYESFLPNLTSKNISPNLDRLLKQAIIDLNKDKRDDIEFTGYVFNVLRALEAVLKFNLDKCGISMNSNAFSMFDKDDSSGNHVLKNRANVSNQNAQKIENCYNFYYNQRHTLFHFGIIIGNGVDNTRFITTKEDANKLIIDTLKIINENYIY